MKRMFPPKKMPRGILFAAAALGALAVPGYALAAETVRIQSRIGSREVYEGDSVRYVVTVENVSDPPTPDVSALEVDFGVRFRGSHDQNSSQVTIINGRMTRVENLARTFEYLLTPRRTGVLTVPPATVDVDGQTYSSESHEVRVLAPEEQDLVRMTLTAEPQTVYPTQSFDVVLTVAVKALPAPHEDQQPVVAGQDGPPRLEIPWLPDESLPDGVKPEKDWQSWLGPLQSRRGGVGFGINDFASSRVSLLFEAPELTFLPVPERVQLAQQDGKTVDYWQYQFRRRFIAERIGEFTFGPVTLKGAIVTGVTDRSLIGAKVFAVAKSVNVVCKDVPLEGRPESYIGAVGVFNGWSADLTPRKASVGTPMTLTLTLKGKGSLDDVTAPDLKRIEGLEDAFKIYEPTREQKGGACTFTYTVRPKKAGNNRLPAIPASYYDVEEAKYVTLETESIPIEVAKADRLTQGDILAATPGGNGGPSHELQRSEEGLFANITDFSALRNQAVHPVPWVVGAGSLGALYAGIALVTLRIRRLHGDEALLRRRGAAAKARKRLREGGDQARAALVGLVADAANVPESGATVKDVSRILQDFGVDRAFIDRVTHVLEKCDAARYSPSQSASSDLQGEAKHVLEEMVRVLRKKRRL